MIRYEKRQLSNGMRVIVSPSPLTSVATFNILYTVGAKNEKAERTGFAHLLEHLMFSGSANISDFDYHVQKVGGDSNAFTTNDFTNYYISLPADNIETAFWLESDRLLSPAFTQERLDVQKKVVVEEFYQHYLNKPFGDQMHYARSLAYKVHPYRWPTIGLEPQHILDATLDEVEKFFYGHYTPSSAILSIVGNVEPERMFDMAEKWFGGIKRDQTKEEIAQEPEQVEERRETIVKDVPENRVMKIFHTSGRAHRDFYLGDILTDILADGDSCCFNQNIIKGTKSMTEVNSYISGSVDPGVLILSGTLSEGTSTEQAEAELMKEVERIAEEGPTEYEMQKAINRTLSGQMIGETSAMQIANVMCIDEAIGDCGQINTDIDKYMSITIDEVRDFAKRTFRRENCSTLLYLKEEK
ncbi:MAG: insulinase family protein [Bacteroidales bacterium]|nr:insulinase family protein [Bacteroidales bacterium]